MSNSIYKKKRRLLRQLALIEEVWHYSTPSEHRLLIEEKKEVNEKLNKLSPLA